MNIEFVKQIPSSEQIKEQLPLPKDVYDRKKQRDEEIKRIFEGKDDRFLLIIGPCSADNEDSVCDYIGRLSAVQDKVEDKVLIIPRIYTNKPRTTGEGYKGMMHQPDPAEENDLYEGIKAIRRLHIKRFVSSACLLRTRCFIRKTILIFPMFLLITQSERVLLRTRVTDLPQAALRRRSA